MTIATSASPKGQSLIALLWTMLKQLALLLATPGAARSIDGLWADTEAKFIELLFERAAQIDPDTPDLRREDYDVELVWSQSGALDFRITPKLHAAALMRAADRAALLELAARRIARARYFLLMGIRGQCRFNRIAQLVNWCERRRNYRRRRDRTHKRARAPKRVAPRILAPP